MPTLPANAYVVNGTRVEPDAVGAGDYTWRTELSCDPGDVATGVSHLVVFESKAGNTVDVSDQVTGLRFRPDPNARETGAATFTFPGRDPAAALSITYDLHCTDNPPLRVR